MNNSKNSFSSSSKKLSMSKQKSVNNLNNSTAGKATFASSSKHKKNVRKSSKNSSKFASENKQSRQFFSSNNTFFPSNALTEEPKNKYDSIPFKTQSQNFSNSKNKLLYSGIQTPLLSVEGGANTFGNSGENNVIYEKKTKDSINRLLNTSNALLNQQNDILNQCDELSKMVSVNDFELSKLQERFESNNFKDNIMKNTENLSNILEKLRKGVKDFEGVNNLREENSSLKNKLKMISIDKSDECLNLEAELNTIKNVYTNEINSMLDYIIEINNEEIKNNERLIPIQKIPSPNSLSSSQILSFFSYLKRLFKKMKEKIEEKDAEIEKLKKKSEDFLQLKESFRKNEVNFRKLCEGNDGNNWGFESKFTKCGDLGGFGGLGLNHNYSEENSGINTQHFTNSLQNSSNDRNNLNKNSLNNFNNTDNILIENNNEFQGRSNLEINQSYVDNFQRSKNLSKE